MVFSGHRKLFRQGRLPPPHCHPHCSLYTAVPITSAPSHQLTPFSDSSPTAAATMHPPPSPPRMFPQPTPSLRHHTTGATTQMHLPPSPPRMFPRSHLHLRTTFIMVTVKHHPYATVTTAAAAVTASQPPKDPNTYRRTKRGRNTKVTQSGGSPKKVGDKAINEEMFDSVERAITTDASLDAAQDSDNIIKTQSMTTLNEPHSQGEGHTSRSGEGRMEHQFELTANVPITPHDSPLPGGYTPGSDEGRLNYRN
ncbi:hypothetical protein Tco_0605611 [Tanacetum coccineum]